MMPARMLQDDTPEPSYIQSAGLSATKKTVWEHNLRSADRYAGYKALWTKVIIRAAFDWVSYRDSTRLEYKKIADDSHRWLFEPNHLFNSFENICNLIDLHPETIRRWVSRLTKDHVAKIEHLERVPIGSTLAMAERRLMAGRGERD